MPSFCFVIHPLSFEDVIRYEPGAAGKGRPIVAKILEWMPAYAAAHVTGVRTPDGRETEGWFVAAPLLPEQMLSLPLEDVYRRINAAIEIGASLGARVAGLGAFSAVVGDGGITVAQRASIPVTTGNSLTVAAGVRSLLRGAHEMGIDPKHATLTVVGATGSIGSACVRLLSPHVERIILVARNESRLRNFHAKLAPELPCASESTLDLNAAVERSHLILTATSSTRDVIEPQWVRPGTVICELSLPHDVSRRIALERPDVLVVEGGNLRVPGTMRWERVREPGTDFDMALPRGIALACMSETMVLALEDRCESFTLGRGIDVEKVREIDELAERCGFSLAGMRAFDKPITDEQIAATRAAAAQLRQARAVVPAKEITR
jgi:predicted amino acid dehydrogenase